MAKSVNDQKKEERKKTISLPMRGRRMFMNEKTNDAALRTEIFKQANSSEEQKIDHENLRWMDHVRQLELQAAATKTEDEKR